MRQTFFIFLLLAAVCAKEDEANEINPLKPPINLDANLRRALLKALTELENEEIQKIRQQESHTPILPHLDTRDKIVEKASASALSFFASTDLSTTTEKLATLLTTTEEATEKPVVIIQRSKGLQHKPITSIENFNLDPVNDAEQILTSASSSFTSSNKYSFGKTDNQEVRSVNNGVNTNLVQDERKTSATKIIRPKIETTTVTTTTSTEESEAKVEDVQFFSAPLVAAFTVHQDERGLPKSVEPIFRPAPPKLQVKPTKPPKVVEETTLDTTTKQQILNKQQDDQMRTQFILQEKQRALEEEILRLKHQQQQHNYLIRQQQLLHEQQLQLQKQKLLEEELRIRNSQQPLREQVQLQSQKFVDEEIRLRNNQEPFVPIVNTNSNQFNQQQNQFRNDFNNHSRVKGSLVSFQPSISFTSNQQTGTLPPNGQQLPIKNAGEFRTPLRAQQPSFQQFSYLSQQQFPSITTTPHFNVPQNFHAQQLPSITTTSNFNIPQSLQTQQLPSVNTPNHHRVFRQESNVGNFVNNRYNSNFYNQVPIQQPSLQQQQQQNRFFRSNGESSLTSPYNFNRIQPPVVNQQLNNLLYNSGIIRDKQHEDLNIVSKVLSLNHYGRDYTFGGSNISEQRLPAPLVKKV